MNRDDHASQSTHAGVVLSRYDYRVVRLPRVRLPRAPRLRSTVLSEFESALGHDRRVRRVCRGVCGETARGCLLRAFRRSARAKAGHGVDTRVDGRIDDGHGTRSDVRADRHHRPNRSRVPALSTGVLPWRRVGGWTVAGHGKRSRQYARLVRGTCVERCRRRSDAWRACGLCREYVATRSADLVGMASAVSRQRADLRDQFLRPDESRGIAGVSACAQARGTRTRADAGGPETRQDRHAASAVLRHGGVIHFLLHLGVRSFVRHPDPPPQ